MAEPVRGPRNPQLAARVRGAILICLGVWALALALSGVNVALAVSAMLVLFELGLLTLRSAPVMRTSPVSPTEVTRVKEALERICGRANCKVPEVSVTGRLGIAAVCLRKRRPTLVISEEFAHRLDDRELDALLAHEVVHLVRDDLFWARVCRGVSMSAGLLLTVLAYRTMSNGPHSDLNENLPILLAAFLLGVLVCSTALSVTNHRRENRADIEGAKLSGDPAALGRGLTVAQAVVSERRRQVFGSQPWKALLWPMSWRRPSHPKMATRIARLDAMASQTPPDEVLR